MGLNQLSSQHTSLNPSFIPSSEHIFSIDMTETAGPYRGFEDVDSTSGSWIADLGSLLNDRPKDGEKRQLLS